MNDKAKIAALRAALDIAIDLANAEVHNLQQAYGDRLQHKHKSAADDVQTIRDAIAILDALTADDAEQAPAALLANTELVRHLVDEALAKVEPLGTIGAMKWLASNFTAPVPPSATADSAADEGLALGDYYRRAERLAKAAEGDGLIITITATPRRPLAMGNFDMVVDIRRSRASYQEAPCP